MKRISFNEQNAEHIYEWLVAYWADTDGATCPECHHLGKRLEVFIGPSSVRRVKRALKKHPVHVSGLAPKEQP